MANMAIPWKNISATQFEELCTRLMREIGYCDVTRMPGNEWGIDIRGGLSVPGTDRSVSVAAQCKIRRQRALGKNDVSSVLGYIASERPSVFLLFSNSHLAPDAERSLRSACQGVNCALICYGCKEIERDVQRYELGLTFLEVSDVFLGRIDRTRAIVQTLRAILDEYNEKKKAIDIRIRATFTSFSNIAHHEGKKIEGLTPLQRTELDDLLLQEGDLLANFVRNNKARVSCILWPERRYIGEYYTLKQKRARLQKLRAFLSENRRSNIQAIVDEAGAYGNQLILGKRVAFLGLPRSGGYTNTMVLHQGPAIEALAREYDSLFLRIQKETTKRLGITKCNGKGQERIRDSCLDMIDGQMEALKKESRAKPKKSA